MTSCWRMMPAGACSGLRARQVWLLMLGTRGQLWAGTPEESGALCGQDSWAGKWRSRKKRDGEEPQCYVSEDEEILEVRALEWRRRVILVMSSSG